ncbi:hypothetical protein PENSPDRAFT_241932 [Peniophora sp. CONT]|nr:hypothetical protein PENSPDRAFT_241932 [Peniophora sp. CONT]
MYAVLYTATLVIIALLVIILRSHPRGIVHLSARRLGTGRLAPHYHIYTISAFTLTTSLGESPRHALRRYSIVPNPTMGLKATGSSRESEEYKDVPLRWTMVDARSREGHCACEEDHCL